jgi:hypothetical protein
MKSWVLVLGLCLVANAIGAQQQIAADCLYRFRKGETTRHQLVINTDMTTEKDSGGAPPIGRLKQNTKQDLVIEQKILEVDESGTAEVQLTFRSAKTEVKISSGAQREPKPPDTLAFLTGKTLKAYVTSDGQVFAVEQVAALIAAARDAAKDAALAELVSQSFSEDYFKELIQNLYPRLPLKPTDAAQGWEVLSDVFLPRTAFKLRVSRKFTLSPAEAGALRLNIRGDIKAVPVDPVTAPNPAQPFVEVLLSSIEGDAALLLDKGLVLNANTVQRLRLRTSMRVQPPRGTPYRTEVTTDTTTTTTVRQLK